MTDRIGRYRTERVLGSGAFATVWLAVDEALDAQVAIKVLAENWAHDQDVRRRFTEEARILWRADSDRIIRVHTVEELPDGRPYFVMAYADRGSLADRMRERTGEGRPFGVDEAVDLATAIAEGLAVAHRLEIVHRDLKPSNVLFQSVPEHQGGGERLVLADFGIARSLAASRGTTIATGTPQYMAPEQAEGRADERSDLYGAAVILYELLAGTVPYPYDTLGQVLRAQREEPVPRLAASRPDVPGALDDLVARAMADDPRARPASAHEWATGLRAAASGAPVPEDMPAAGGLGATMGPEELARQRAAGAASEPPPAPAAPPPAPGAPPPPPAPPPAPPQPAPSGGEPPGPSRKRRRPWVAVGALAGVGAVVAVLALLASGGDDSGTPTVGELFLEPISEVGPDPFTGSLVPDLPDLPSPEELLDTVTLPTAPAGAPEGAVTTISGAAPGLYGGTKQLSVCDATQLVSFLETNADKATAWAAAVGIPVEMIGAYVAGLTDVILQRDVRVTNHGFAEGQATSRQSVLQAGTAVLVDEFGVPRVRCYCGNPLLAPEPAKAEPELVGAPWPGFDATGVIVIQATDPVDEFVIRDLVEGGLLGRPPGTPATEATQIEAPPGGEATTSTTAATGPLQNLQPGATSSFSGTAGSFPAGLAFDGDPSTSWFSIGTGDPAPTLTAQALADTLFTEVSITGNGANRRAEFRTGFGFSSVDVVVTDVEGVEVFRETVQLPGTPDPTVTVRPGVVGRSLALVFHGHESPDCGGVAEVLILGSSA